MAQHLEGLMNTSMEKIRDLVDVNTIVGEPITSPDGTIIIPISKVSFGFVSGGSDVPAKVDKDVFAGGAGAGITIKPQAFIVIQADGEVKMLELGVKGGTIDGIVENAPELLNKVKEIFAKKKKDDDEE
ncbi:MAG: GerW family sporulation protein [Bacteroides sp.]|nr:GerW family sporulation protein [Eubacterium sp.]MCM1419018.1 GerW family sporulation protein [Roseburia sp.]MCM1462860.1 GerW family sporulation protein [Bacteroides sp.]